MSSSDFSQPSPSPTAKSLLGPALLGIDPGRAKCGLAVVGLDRSLHYHQVIAVDSVTDTIQTLRETYPVSNIILGDQTGSKQWKQTLEALPNAPRVILVDERYSSLEARDRYWEMYPPKGFSKLVPQSFRSIPRPIDDIVAILLIERYLKRLSGEG